MQTTCLSKLRRYDTLYLPSSLGRKPSQMRNEHIQESFAYFDGVTVESLYNLLENRRVGHFDGYDVPQAPLKKRSKDGPSLYSIGGSTPTESIQHHHPMMRLLPPGPDVFSGHQLAPIRLKFPLRSNNHGSRQ
ncbi:hypothetical protein SeMB42_g04258 [Synchytrium endobioticum]|uniref:Uncharacterized protein n=1 Tax=Synchytrium endobioticum TaxID=286115 RepID=A0A507CZK5_9FUNG|nr:hypothetical protein SeMB42_g04258 [Synchytrium endobioticum]